MRTLLLELRPDSLVQARMDELLGQLGRAMTGRTGVPVHVLAECDCALPPAVQIALYRMAQEALNNAGKHADASAVHVHMTCEPNHVELTISDDGRGFEVGSIAPGHLGLGIMRERADGIGAALEIESQPGHGTKILIVWSEDDYQVVKNEE